jgi:hypothetical protein
MVSNRLALGALAIACVAAAAGGGYLAARQNTAAVVSADAAAEPAAAPALPTEVAAVPAPAPEVRETGSHTVRHEGLEPVRPAVSRPPERPRPAPARTSERTAQPARSVSGRQTAPPVAAVPAPPLEARTIASPVVTTPSVPPGQLANLEQFVELVVPADSVIGLQLDAAVTSERAAVEDKVEARVVRDVRVDDEVAVPAGTRAIGSVVLVERGGRFKERARLGIRFHTLVLADNTELPLATETIYRYGDPPGGESAKKIGGGAVAGAILGAILGGSKGAAIGATAGAGGGTAAVLAGDVNAATFAAGTELTARILSPVTVTIER